MQLVALVLLALFVPLAQSQPNYSKSAELPALRVSVADLQPVLEKAVKLAHSANGASGDSSLREELTLRAGPMTIAFDGHEIVPVGAKVPNQLDGLNYRYTVTSGAAISGVSLDFNEYRRSITVSGQSPELVESLFAAVREDLDGLSSAFGGSGTTILLGFPSYFIMTIFVLWAFSAWVADPSLPKRLLLAVAVIGWLLVFFLPTKEIFSGFVVSRTDPAFTVKYAAQVTLVGLALSFISLVPKSLFRSGNQRARASALTGEPSATQGAGVPALFAHLKLKDEGEKH